ncbi:MAG: M56 family metallopeptidase [Gemmatimonadaceae bacterium]
MKARLDYLTAALALREQSHRRATLLAIGALLLLSTGPVFGHHLPFGTAALFAGVDHLGALCLTALHLLLAPVHRGFHVVIVAGLVYAVWNRFRAWRIVRRSLELLDGRSPVERDVFRAAAGAAGVDPRLLRIVRGLPSPAFTAGLARPRIYVAESLADRLDAGQLAAVLAHEGAHVARRDPLRLTLFRALACTLFWIPALRRLADDVADEAEVLADDAAAAGRPLVLASAILALAQWPETTGQAMGRAAGAVGFHQPDLLDRRIRRLVGEETPVRSHVTRRSVLGAAAALVLVWTSGVLMAHPLPSASPVAHERHCDHRDESALAHLFCLGSARHTAPAHCPHQHSV